MTAAGQRETSCTWTPHVRFTPRSRRMQRRIPTSASGQTRPETRRPRWVRCSHN